MNKYNLNDLNSLCDQNNEEDLKEKLNLKYMDLINKTTFVVCMICQKYYHLNM